jgi:hypothetical protein
MQYSLIRATASSSLVKSSKHMTSIVTSPVKEKHELRKCISLVRKCITNLKICTSELYKIVSHCNMAPRRTLTWSPSDEFLAIRQ